MCSRGSASRPGRLDCRRGIASRPTPPGGAGSSRLGTTQPCPMRRQRVRSLRASPICGPSQRALVNKVMVYLDGTKWKAVLMMRAGDGLESPECFPVRLKFSPGSQVRRIHYAWVVAAVTFVALMGAAGFRATPSVLIVPLQNEFGWNRAIISIAVSINLILFGLTGPFAAALMDRFGLRVVTVGALITVATGALLTTVMNAPWQLYLLWGVVVGLGTGCMASVLAATVANRWFVHRRRLVLRAPTAACATRPPTLLPRLGGVP